MTAKAGSLKDKATWLAHVEDAPIDGLIEIMRQLRDPDSGCPWDLQQTMASIIPHTIEETYEVAHAIMHETPGELCDELGDLLFQVIFYAQLGAEQGWFQFADIAKAVSHKLIRRHPHIFDETCTLTPDEVEVQWRKIKQAEKAQQTPRGLLADIPTGMPPLLRAQKIQKACAKVGFDWGEIAPVIDKVREELVEVEQALASQSPAAIEDEIGDLLFAVVNVARHAGVNSEAALMAANQKFATRFAIVEALAHAQQVELSGLSEDELDVLWERAKAQLKKRD